MTAILSQLNSKTGTYVGQGINHESQPFTGVLTLSPALNGRGVHLQFTATGSNGTVFHQEESTIAPSIAETLTLWNFNSNTPGLVPHELREATTKPGAEASMVFGFGDTSNRQSFREEIALDIWNTNSLSYTYSWGLPGGDFKERSGVKMTKQPDVESARGLFEKYQLEINKHDFNAVAPMIAADCKFWFSSGTFEGSKQTRNAFEKTWGMIKDEVYTVTDVQWIAESSTAATCTYTFHWRGLIDGEPREGKGRGTSAFRRDSDGWKIVHEHLSHFPG